MVFESLLLWKILVSVGAVLGLSLVAEAVSPKLAGLLAGYPLGSAIALFFIGLEQSAEFAAAASVHTLVGFTASLVLAWAYFQSASHLKLPQLFKSAHIVAAGILSGVAFLITSWLLQQVSWGLLGGTLLTIVAILFFHRCFQSIKSQRIQQRVRLTRAVLVFRAGMAALIICLVTAFADWLGPVWSGLFSAFPITFFPFMLIIHLAYGKELVGTVIKHYPLGLGALICYTLTVSQCYPIFGVGWGTAIAFAVASLYLLMLYLVSYLKLRTANMTKT